MPGPTTEVLNDDMRALRDEFHRAEVAIKDDIRRVEVELKGDGRVLDAKVGGIITLGKILLVLSLTSLAASIWWGATLTADVRNLGDRMDEKFKAVDARFEKLESRIDRFESKIEARFDKLEASIAKVLEQTKTKP